VSPLVVSCVLFGCIAAAGLVGMLVARVLPGHHLAPESRDAVKQGLALIATLSALVLGLLVAAAKGSYDSNTNTVRQMAADVMLLDRLLAQYGTDTKEARDLLRRMAEVTLNRLWPDSGQADVVPGAARADADAFFEKLAALNPRTDAQRSLKARALDVINGLMQTRLRLFAQKDSNIPTPFLVVLALWLMILFAGIGLMAPYNHTVVVVLTVCALSVAGALFLILELDRPFEGLMRVSSSPVREAVSRLGS
jgi:hypothetical protein